MKKVALGAVLALTGSIGVARADLIDETFELIDSLEGKYLEAVAAEPRSRKYKEFDTLLSTLKQKTTEIGKVRAKSKLAEVKAAKVYYYASKIATLYKSALKKQSMSVIDAHISERNKFLAATDIIRDHKFSIYKLKEGLGTLKLYGYPEFTAPYKNKAELFSRYLNQFVKIAKAVELESQTETLLTKIETASRSDLHTFGASYDYLNGQAWYSYYRKGRYPHRRTLTRGAVTYEVRGYSKNSNYDGEYTVEDTVVTCKSESGKKFTTSRMNHKHQEIDSDVFKELSAKLSLATKAYPGATSLLAELVDTKQLKGHLSNSSKWVRAVRSGKRVSGELTSDFNYARECFKEILDEIKPVAAPVGAPSLAKDPNRKYASQYSLSEDTPEPSSRRNELIQKMVDLRKAICPVVHSSEYSVDVDPSDTSKYLKSLTHRERDYFDSLKRSNLARISKGDSTDTKQKAINRALYYSFRCTRRYLSSSRIKDSDIEEILHQFSSL